MHHGGAGGDSPLPVLALSVQYGRDLAPKENAVGRAEIVGEAGKCLAQRVIYASRVAFTEQVNGSAGQAFARRDRLPRQRWDQDQQRGDGQVAVPAQPTRQLVLDPTEADGKRTSLPEKRPKSRKCGLIAPHQSRESSKHGCCPARTALSTHPTSWIMLSLG
jgi:hypothetical protein